MKIILLSLAILLAIPMSAQDSGKLKLKPTAVLVIPKYVAVRSVGLIPFNDELANSGIDQLGIIGLGFGVDVDFHFKNLSLGFEYQSFSYTNLNFNNISFSGSAPSLSNNISLSGNDLSGKIGYNLLGKSEQYRLEPFVGIGAKTTKFSISSNDTTSFSNVLSGEQNSYQELPKTSLVLIPGFRFIAFNDKVDLSLQVDYRYMASRYQWQASGLPITRLSGIAISIGLVVDLQKLFGGKED